jgi:hypothetical protein
MSLQDINHSYIIPSLVLEDDEVIQTGNADPKINAWEMKKALGKNKLPRANELIEVNRHHHPIGSPA